MCARVTTPLPELLRPLFWDTDFASLDWEGDRNLVVRRILQSGSWPAIRWLRATMGDAAIREWLMAHTGSRLSPRQLRYWELVLDLPAKQVDIWVSLARKNPWERRIMR
jgi:hypothetical protein